VSENPICEDERQGKEAHGNLERAGSETERTNPADDNGVGLLPWVQGLAPAQWRYDVSTGRCDAGSAPTRTNSSRNFARESGLHSTADAPSS